MVNDLGASIEGAGADEGPAAEVVATITAAGGSAIADGHDVSDAAGAQALVDAATDIYGRLDVLINNAGVIRWAGFPEADAENLAAHLVHLWGSFRTTRAAWPTMVGGFGRVVMTTSSGVFGLPRTWLHAPGAVIGLAWPGYAGAKRGIKVNCIAPAASPAWPAGAAGGSGPHGPGPVAPSPPPPTRLPVTGETTPPAPAASPALPGLDFGWVAGGGATNPRWRTSPLTGRPSTPRVTPSPPTWWRVASFLDHLPPPG